MATNNAINVGPSATGQLAVGQGVGITPIFTTSADATFTFTSTTASVTRMVTVSNTDNTIAATSAANTTFAVGGGNVGDPSIRNRINTVYEMDYGIDNSNADVFSFSASSSLGSSQRMAITTAGEITYQVQPAFFAYESSTVTNATGDGTLVLCGNTEVYDQNSDYNNATRTFTAPVTGRYKFSGCATVSNIAAGHTNGLAYILTSNRQPARMTQSPIAARGANGQLSFYGSVIVDMDAADTCSFNIRILNSTKTVSVNGGASPHVTYFSGQLVV